MIERVEIEKLSTDEILAKRAAISQSTTIRMVGDDGIECSDWASFEWAAQANAVLANRRSVEFETTGRTSF